MKPLATVDDLVVGKWLSAALEDPKVCQAMKDDINEWFESKRWPEEENKNTINYEKINPDREDQGESVLGFTKGKEDE